MANQVDPRLAATRPAAGVDAGYDEGLRSYMLSIYNYMASGVLLTGVVAVLFARGGENSLAAQIFMQPGILKWVIMLAPLGLVMVLSFGINKLSEGAAKGDLLGLCRADGRVAVDDPARLHRRVGGQHLLCRGRRLRRAQPLWLHDQA